MSVIATTLMPFVQMIGVVPNEKVRLKNIFSQRDQQNQYSTPHSIKTDSLHQSIYIEADLLKRRSLPLRRPTVYEASAMENFREIYLCLLYMSANEKDVIRSRLSYRRRWLYFRSTECTTWCTHKQSSTVLHVAYTKRTLGRRRLGVGRLSACIWVSLVIINPTSMTSV